MVDFRQSLLPDLVTSNTFLWCTGIEDTFITAPSPKTGRTLDEYELTDHYGRWRSDLELMSQLGVRCARYGIPWHRINPRAGVWEWRWADEPLEKLLELGIAPIVDLVHYGLPPWIENAFLNPDYPKYVAEYASRVAERFKGRIHAYTPLNEPRITAWYCGKIGWWPPFRHGWRGYVAVTRGVCRGIVSTVEALRAVDPEILPVHVDATDLYRTSDPELEAESRHRQELVFLALDLISGRVKQQHPLYDWLVRHDFTPTDLEWFQTHAVPLPLIGINLYPMFTNKVLSRTRTGRLRIAMRYADGALIEQLGALYWERYHSPLFISETASTGSVDRRQRWLDDSIEAVRRVRSRGVPLIGYTWWPLFALVTWAYRQGHHPPQYYLKQMGLWDLDSSLERVSTPLVANFRRLVDGGCTAVGALSPTSELASAQEFEIDQ
jgi:beta-glucosidase/6-phospho-beta-glucosidase/beta-galactosidase